ncbi:MAG: rod shape-determining protein MreD [Anaerolineae bacterium]
MSPYAATALLAALVVAQASLVPVAALGGQKPLLPVLAVASWGLVAGGSQGLWWSVALGLLLDAASPAPPGMYTVPLFAAGLVAAASRRRLAPANMVLPAAVAAGATLAFTLVQRLLLAAVLATRASGAPAIDWAPSQLLEDLVPVTVLNLVWLPIVYFPLRWLSRRGAPPRMDWEA